jgi:hypothetical protein
MVSFKVRTSFRDIEDKTYVGTTESFREEIPAGRR